MDVAGLSRGAVRLQQPDRDAIRIQAPMRLMICSGGGWRSPVRVADRLFRASSLLYTTIG